MPHIKDGELVLSEREKLFYQFYFENGGRNATDCARRAGYSERTARVRGHKLKKWLSKGVPIEAWKNALHVAGWDYARIIGLLNRVETEGRPKDLLNLARLGLASYGVPTSGESVRNLTLIAADRPQLMVIGDGVVEATARILRKGRRAGELEASKDTALDAGAPPYTYEHWCPYCGKVCECRPGGHNGSWPEHICLECNQVVNPKTPPVIDAEAIEIAEPEAESEDVP